MRRSIPAILAFSAFLTLGTTAFAQTNLVTPPGGANQRSVVTQYMGLVAVTIDYNSPDVHAPNGDDRRGKIWGQLVPYGFTNLGFGNGNPGPWRVGANENTTITFSHDVEVQGEPIAAGTYGLHMAVGELFADASEAPSPGKPVGEEWTIIFSHNSTAWGSFFYDQAEDALRVTATPEKAPYREWLSFDFIDRQLDSTTVALQWEELQVPFTITVPDIKTLYVEKLRQDLQSSAGFSFLGWNTAANYCLANDVNLEEALTWAETAISSPFFGNRSFTTLSTKSQILAKLGRTEEAEAVMQEAIEDPATTVFEVHGYGRQLITQGQNQKALEVFQHNAERFPDTWPIHVGLARGYSAVGQYDKALEHAKLAHANAPDDLNRDGLAASIAKLEKGEDIN